MQRFDILDPQVNIFQSRFLEASAGTGKTFAIEHLVVRLLRESKEPITLQEILAVTFTREAAYEMKTRIRKKLKELEGEQDPRILDALASFDEIPIFTIHGFCHRMLTEFAFEAKSPLTLNPPDRPHHLEEMRQVVEDFFHTGDKKYSVEVTSLLKRMRYDLDRLIHSIVEAMQKKQEPTPCELPSLPVVPYEELLSNLLSLSSRYKRMKLEKYQEQVKKLALYLEHKDYALLTEEKIWFFEKLKEERGFFHTLRTQLEPPLKLLRSPEEMVLRIAKECQQRWKIKAARQDHSTFDDLLTKMREALKIPHFYEKVKSKYKVAIVDEFQDTDPVQWEIFEKLFLPTHLLYLVGDPKQSIYRFRGADLYTYLRAGESLGKNAKAHLDTNFRSSPQLVAALNELFTKNLGGSAFSSFSYHPVKAGRTENHLEEEPITFFGVKGDPGRERNFPTKTMEEESLFPYIAGEILRLKKFFTFSDFAVLIKDRFQAKRLQVYLSRLKIPSTIKRTLHLAESRGFLAMELFLKAVAHPRNPSHVKTALKGPLMEGEENPFLALQQIFETKGFPALFTHFLDHHFKAYGETSLYLEFCQTAELLMQSHKAQIFELLHLMQKWKQTNPEMEEKLQLRGEEGEDKVAIMTTFASKGLEFEVVFALGMASRSSNEEDSAEEEAEKMRQLYVAFTRAREKLYIPCLVDPSQKLPPPGTESPIELFLRDREVPIEWIQPKTPRSYKIEKEKTLLYPPPEVSLEFPIEILTSFSSMAKTHVKTLLAEQFHLQDLAQKTVHTLPLGAETGSVIHTVFETYFQDPAISYPQLVSEILAGTHLEGWEEVVVQMLKEVLHLPLLENFSLSQLKKGEYFQEMEFLFREDKQWIKGFIDLVFQRGDTFYVVDWKTNWLGPSQEDYTEDRLQLAMKEHNYFLQAKLYREALARYVKPLYKHSQFGGAFYMFLRGNKAVWV